MGTLKECFSLLNLVPRDLVAKHSQLVRSCDDFDNETCPYTSSDGTIYFFSCSKEKNIFSKDKCKIKVSTMRLKEASDPQAKNGQSAAQPATQSREMCVLCFATHPPPSATPRPHCATC